MVCGSPIGIAEPQSAPPRRRVEQCGRIRFRVVVLGNGCVIVGGKYIETWEGRTVWLKRRYQALDYP